MRWFDPVHCIESTLTCGGANAAQELEREAKEMLHAFGATGKSLADIRADVSRSVEALSAAAPAAQPELQRGLASLVKIHQQSVSPETTYALISLWQDPRKTIFHGVLAQK